MLRATLATDAVIGAFASPSYPGTAYVLLHHVMGEAGGSRGVWGYVQGGMGGLTDGPGESLSRSGRRNSPRSRRSSGSSSNKGQVAGVALWDDTLLEAPVVASSIDAHQTFERLLDPAELPAEFRTAVAKIDYASASAKINLALSELPNFTCLPSSGIAPHHRGTIHISPTLDYMERAFDDAKYGWPSTEPILEITLPTSVDHTLAPPGQHVMNIFVQYAPYKLAEGQSWDDIKEDFADRCMELLARYAPNIPSAVLHRQVLTPLDLERLIGLTGGNIMQGAMTPQQLFMMRPGRRLGRPPHAHPRPLPLRRRQPSRRRRARRLRPERRRGNPAGWVTVAARCQRRSPLFVLPDARAACGLRRELPSPKAAMGW